MKKEKTFKDILTDLIEFHNFYKVDYSQDVTLLDEKTSELRFKLMEEENNEYLEACKNKDIVEIADALGDKLYILAGTIISHGLQDKIVDIFNEIHRSNLSKLGADGKPVYREDGKVKKGPNYSPPDIKTILMK